MVNLAFQTCQRFSLDINYNLRFEMLPNGQPWKVDPFVSISPLFAAVATGRHIMDRLASIYEGYEAVLFKDKLVLKPTDSHGNGIHQDYNWWQGFPKSLLTVAWIIQPEKMDVQNSGRDINRGSFTNQTLLMERLTMTG